MALLGLLQALCQALDEVELTDILVTINMSPKGIRTVMCYHIYGLQHLPSRSNVHRSRYNSQRIRYLEYKVAAHHVRDRERD